MIPHIIHYFWFGGAPKPEVVIKCIDSWKEYFPDWEIKEWNEANYDIKQNKYMVDAYSLKKYAFVSDYARFDILYKHGGIYVDVDVEFIKRIPEELLQLNCFTGFQGTGEVSPGLIFAVEPNHWLCKEILDSYNNERFIYNEKGIYKTINMRTSEILEKYGLLKQNEYQKVKDIHIFPSEYFCGYDTDIREPIITNNTICWHHYLGSWGQKNIKRKLQDILKKVIGKESYKRLILLKRKIKNRVKNDRFLSC